MARGYIWIREGGRAAEKSQKEAGRLVEEQVRGVGCMMGEQAEQSAIVRKPADSGRYTINPLQKKIKY